MKPLPLEREGYRGVIEAVVLVFLFWWLATGLLLGLPRDPLGREAAAVVASLLGGAGLGLTMIVRQDNSPRGAAIGFLAGGTLWGWVQAALYGGWLVGPGIVHPPVPSGDRLADAMAVLHATSWNEVASIGVLVLAAGLGSKAPNRMPFWTVLLFWTAHQAARLNIFFGVSNLDASLLPEHLAFLAAFVGPRSNTPLLWLTVLLWSGLTVWLVRRARSSGSGFQRQGALLLATLAGLAALEHALLGMPAALPLWGPFLGHLPS